MIYKYIFKIIITLLFLPIGFTSCVDENIIEPGTDKPDIEEDPIEGYSIGFKIQLDKNMSGNTRGAEDYENYIDTRNKFRVLFFTEDGQFLFGAVDRTITALGEQSGTGVASWYVRVPMNYLVDREGNPYDADEIKKYLRENDFKVAILANWPNNATLRSDIEDEDSGNTTEDTYIEREPKWGWKQSIFSDEENEIKNINDLHHLVIDKNYNDNSSSSSRPSRRQVYDFVMDGDVSNGEGKMGVKTDWVKMRDISEDFNGEYNGDTFSDQQSAETWIRKNWDPGKKSGDRDNVYRNYNNIWQLWNFSGNYTASYDEIMRDRNNTSTGSMPPAFKSAWQNRNGNDLSKFLNDNPYGLYSRFTFDGLSFEPTTNDGNRCYAYVNGDNRGIVLKPAEELGGEGDNSYIHPTKTPFKSRGYLHFTAYSTGTYRIRYGALNGKATMVVQHNTNRDRTYKDITEEGPTQMSYKSGDIEYFYRDLSITGDPENIYIWSASGDLVIYSIEWISSKYLYDTDRIGIEPSEENPIPMYGVQNFSKLGDSWEEGTTFDISAARGQEDVKPISLIRSLAKVEVYLPQKAKHIYMRSMNRTSRCEPIDVQTPTNELWHQNHSQENSQEKCEWFDIQSYDHGLEYYGDTPPSSNSAELEEYTNWLSWFYGSWEGWWNFNSHNISGGTVTIPSNPNYPHLFYPDINRSDFCHLIYVGYVAGKGHKYILYMPEKNISDPNYVGFKKSIPKVAHIEYRYDNNTDNLEDNECRRIYFTNYTYTSDTSLGPINTFIKNVSKDGYEIYERNQVIQNNVGEQEDHLRLHWPIMRNHIYEFIVNSSGHGEPTIRAKVKDWNERDIVVEW